MTEEIDINILHELIRDIAGKSAEPIADILRNKDEVNEYKIADKLKITVNQVRNILYKLFDKSIVSFTRKKDKQKGWYIYFWTLNVQKALTQFVNIKEKEIDEINHQITGLETKHYYSCPSGCVELSEEHALNYNFICQECGQLLALSAKKERIKDFKTTIDKFNRQIGIARKELAEIEAEELKRLEKEKIKKLKQRRAKMLRKRRTKKAKTKKARKIKEKSSKKPKKKKKPKKYKKKRKR